MRVCAKSRTGSRAEPFERGALYAHNALANLCARLQNLLFPPIAIVLAFRCGPCVKISPFFAKLAEEHTDVAFAKVDVDECEQSAQAFGVEVRRCARPSFLALSSDPFAAFI